MNAKQKPTKPVKAWAYIDRITGHIDAYPSAFSRNYMRDRPIYRPAETWRIARVEIREVGR